MIILSVESSAVSASAAVMRDGKILHEEYTESALTHSVTLLPQIKKTLDECDLTLDDVSLFAVANGPGSFTGLRIGVAAVKGLALWKTPCLGVSTLEAMAYLHADCEGAVCACMDARCSQVYNAFFDVQSGNPVRLCEDRAIMLSDLENEIKKLKKDVFLVGDGAKLCYNSIKENLPSLLPAVSVSQNCVLQRASGVCKAAYAHIMSGEKLVLAENLGINYLRLPQAERELKKKESLK